MNKLFLLLILPLIFFACDYQRKSKEDIPQNSTRKSYISIFKSVSIADSLYVYLEDQQRVFFVNVFNPFQIKTNFLADSILLETNKNSEIRKDNDTFYIKTDKIGRINLTILFFKNGKRIEARSKELRFQRLPKGSPKFGGLFDGESMAYSNITRELTLQIDAFNKDEVDFSYLHKIKEFIVCTYSEGKMIENKSFSEKISEDQWTQLKMLNTGNKFYIENIIIMQLDNSLKNIGSMMLKIE